MYPWQLLNAWQLVSGRHSSSSKEETASYDLNNTLSFSVVLFFIFCLCLCSDLHSRWRKRLNLNGKGGGHGESRKWEEKMIERPTRWGVCENQNERQTSLLYILEAVGQYLNNSWGRTLEGFFYSGCWTPQAEGLPTFLSPWGQGAALQTAVDYIHLSNLLHLPRCTSCLIHQVCSFPNFRRPPSLRYSWWTDDG